LNFVQQRLVRWIAAPQGVKADGLVIQIDHSTNQAMEPISMGATGLPRP